MFNKLITAFGSKQDSNQPETKEDEAARLRNEMYAAFGNTSAPAWRASRPTTAATPSRPTTAARPDSAAGRPKPLETPKTPMLGAKKVSPTSILSSGETQWSGSSAQSAASSRPSSKQSTRSSVDGGAPMRSPRESGDTGNSQPVPSRTTRASEPSGRPASRGVAAPVTPIRLSMARAGSTDTAACKAVAQTSLTSPKRYCRASADGVVCSAQDDSLSLHLQPHRSARGPVGESSIGSSSSATYGYVAERPSSGTRASPCLIQAGLATRPSQPAASAGALNRAGSLGGWQKMPVVA